LDLVFSATAIQRGTTTGIWGGRERKADAGAEPHAPAL